MLAKHIKFFKLVKCIKFFKCISFNINNLTQLKYLRSRKIPNKNVYPSKLAFKLKSYIKNIWYIFNVINQEILIFHFRQFH